MQLINDIPVFGEPLMDAVKQIETVLKCGAVGVALMADHHLGYACPIGGVAAYRDQVSPSGVGYDIACGNAAVRTNFRYADMTATDIEVVADMIAEKISFGIGTKNGEAADNDVFKDPAWDLEMLRPLKEMAREQLGTVGAGNHYVDCLVDGEGYIWIANHFGSRGLGHKIATHFIKAAGGKDGMFVEPVVFDVHSDVGKDYLAAMELAGRYAYAGRDWVIGKIVDIFGSIDVIDYIHNHHNFAWREHHFGEDLWVVRKGATPMHPGQRGFIGGSMGDISVVVKGREQAADNAFAQDFSYYSAPHGAGRIMSRTQAAGKTKFKDGHKVRVSDGAISHEMMMDAIKGVTLRGAYMDEAPQVYKDLNTVIGAHAQTLYVEHVLTPVIVVMASSEVMDPYKD